MKEKIPKLPQLLDRKIYKTGQTRGADDDVIFQNRVGRNSTTLIPFQFWNESFMFPEGETNFENGYIVLLNPTTYFEDKNITDTLKKKLLKLGENCLVFYETRADWDKYNPDKLKWNPAESRISPLGGNYVARVPATTATNNGSKVIRGFTTTAGKGAGIRLYEYASSDTILKCRLQLEAIFWLCYNSIDVVSDSGMTREDADKRKKIIFEKCKNEGLLDYEKLNKARMIDGNNQTTCPLCLERLTGAGFLNRMAQAEGREVPDLTVTEINLFHINELRYGVYNHKPYNLSWGHHHCNVVTKDSGITETLRWMKDVLDRNNKGGFTI